MTKPTAAGGLYTVVYCRNWVYTVVWCLFRESTADQIDSLEFMNYKLTCSSLLKKKIIKPLHLIASPPCCVPTEGKKREGPCVVSMARKGGGSGGMN